MDEGIDFAVPSGTRVTAAASGIVTYSGWAKSERNDIFYGKENISSR